MTFYIEQTKTGNREFSATVTQSASARAFDFPTALGIAAKLAAELALLEGRKLVREHLASKSIKSKCSGDQDNITDCDGYNDTPVCDQKTLGFTPPDGTPYIYFYYDSCTYDTTTYCGGTGNGNSGRSTCNSCPSDTDNPNTSDQQTTCVGFATCQNQICGCPSGYNCT
jgi:hypothetical protein